MKTDNLTKAAKRSDDQNGLTLPEAVIVMVIVLLLVSFLLPPVTRSREAARRAQCKYNLRRIGTALELYQSDYGVFPPAYTVDKNGERLHSWRTLILPYLDQKELYRSIDLTKPWGHPANFTLQATDITAYRCPSSRLRPQQTAYLAMVTAESCLRPERSLSPSEITDGPENTVVIFEAPVASAVSWISPMDADELIVLSSKETTKQTHTGGTHVLMADGSAKTLSDASSKESRRALVTAAGNDTDVRTFFD